MLQDQKTEFEELKGGLVVRIAALHQDAEGQAQLAFRAGELAAELKAEAKRARLALEQAEADADREVRGTPASFGLDKITESAVRNAVVSHTRVRAAEASAIEVEKDADLAQSLANAYEHRRSMLKLEVDLYLGNYYGDPEARERDMRRPAQAAAGAEAAAKEQSVEAQRAERRRRIQEAKP